MRKAQPPPARFSVGHSVAMSKRPDYERDREKNTKNNGPILRNNNGNGTYTLGKPTSDMVRYLVGASDKFVVNEFMGQEGPSQGNVQCQFMNGIPSQKFIPENYPYPHPTGPVNRKSTRVKKKKDGKHPKSKKPTSLGLGKLPVPGSIKTTVGCANQEAKLFEQHMRHPDLYYSGSNFNNTNHFPAGHLEQNFFDSSSHQPTETWPGEETIPMVKIKQPKPICPNNISSKNTKKPQHQVDAEDILNNNDLFDGTMLRLPSGPFMGQDIVVRRNEALVNIWTDSGPFSRVDAMMVACSVLESKLNDAVLAKVLEPRRQVEFSKFCAEINEMLGLHANQADIFNSINPQDYRKLWHLFGIFDGAMNNRLSSYEQAEKLGVDGPPCALNSSEILRTSTNFSGDTKPNLQRVDPPTIVVKTMNPVLADVLLNSLRAFLIVYGRFVEIGNVRKCPQLTKNTLNIHIHKYHERFSAAVPGTSKRLPPKLEFQLENIGPKYVQHNHQHTDYVMDNVQELVPTEGQLNKFPEMFGSNADISSMQTQSTNDATDFSRMNRFNHNLEHSSDIGVNDQRKTESFDSKDEQKMRLRMKKNRKQNKTILPAWAQPNIPRLIQSADVPGGGRQVENPKCSNSSVKENGLASLSSFLPKPKDEILPGTSPSYGEIEGSCDISVTSIQTILSKTIRKIESSLSLSEKKISYSKEEETDETTSDEGINLTEAYLKNHNEIYTIKYIPPVMNHNENVKFVLNLKKIDEKLNSNENIFQKKSSILKRLNSDGLQPSIASLSKTGSIGKQGKLGNKITTSTQVFKSHHSKNTKGSKSTHTKCTSCDKTQKVKKIKKNTPMFNLGKNSLKNTELSLINIIRREECQNINKNLESQIQDGSEETKCEKKNPIDKKLLAKMKKELKKIQAQSQAFQRSVTIKEEPKPNIPKLLKATRVAIRQKKKMIIKSKSMTGPLIIRKQHNMIAKNVANVKKKKPIVDKCKNITTPTRKRASTAPPNFASPEMKQMFIKKGIFTPRGYQLTKNSLSPISRVKAICLEGCRYDVVKRIALQIGFKEVPESDVWNIIWTDVPISLDKALEMRRFQDAHSIFWGTMPPLQKANHFPGMNEICRKDRLARNLNRMRKSFPTEYDFFPKTWSLPADISDLLVHARVKRNSTYICKPDSGCQGRGIFLIRNLKKLNPFAKLICQVYIPRPFLIDGYKFDLRIYILITSCDPLHIYIYNEGIARFATVKYEPPCDENVDVIFMHLTNYSLNKFSQSYAPDPEGSKRKLSGVLNWMAEERMDTRKLLADIDAVIVKTMIAAQPTLRHYYRASFPKCDRGCACFEILGFDILLDQHLKPFLLEVNHSPSFNLDLPVDAEIKEALLRDTFNKIYLGSVSEKPKYEQKRPLESPSSSFTLTDSAGHSLSKALEIQFRYESRHKGNFRLIYPSDNSLKYAHFFDQTTCPTMIDAALLAKRRAETCSNTAIQYGYPPINPENPYIITRSVDKHGVVSTSKKNKNISYIKIAYNPDEDDDDHVDDNNNDLNENDSFYPTNLQQKSYKGINYHIKNACIHDILNPIGTNGVREPLTFLEGNPKRKPFFNPKNLLPDDVIIQPHEINLQSNNNNNNNNHKATTNNFNNNNNHHHHQNEKSELIQTTTTTNIFDNAMNNKDLNLILGSDFRSSTIKHRKIITKDILEKVQHNRGILTTTDQKIIPQNFTVSMDRYKLSIPPKVNNNNNNNDNNNTNYENQIDIPISGKSLVFKYPTPGKDLASSLSPYISNYPSLMAERHYQQQQQQQQGPTNSQSFLDKIMSKKDNRNQPMENSFKNPNDEMKKDIIRVLTEVRTNKNHRHHTLLTGDKVSLIQQWILDAEKENFCVTNGDELNGMSQDYQNYSTALLNQQKSSKKYKPEEYMYFNSGHRYKSPHPFDSRSRSKSKHRAIPLLHENREQMKMQPQAYPRSHYKQDVHKTDAIYDRETGTMYQVFKHGETDPVGINNKIQKTNSNFAVKQLYSRNDKQISQQQQQNDTNNNNNPYVFQHAATSSCRTLPGIPNSSFYPTSQYPPKRNDGSSHLIQGRPPHLRNH